MVGSFIKAVPAFLNVLTISIAIPVIRHAKVATNPVVNALVPTTVNVWSAKADFS